MTNKRQTGAKYEQMAADFLTSNGVSITERNFRNRFGEIDLVARDGEYLVFVEVKYRSSARKGSPQEAVNYAKQRKICKVADYYRMTHKISESTAVRYDVIGIMDGKLEWYKNAFEHIYS